MEMLNNPFFGVILILFFFEVGKYIFNKTKLPIFNPILIAGLGIVLIIDFFNIPMEYFSKGGDIVEFFLAPATVLLVIPLYKQMDNLKKYWKPILIGGVVGSIIAIASIYFLGKLLNIDMQLVISFLPKSITTPFGIEASKMIGGIPSLTVFGIMVTGITGNMMAVLIFKLIGEVHPIAKGVGIGVSSHAVGTSKAMEMGEVEGAMSALTIVIAGVVTIVLLQLALYFK